MIETTSVLTQVKLSEMLPDFPLYTQICRGLFSCLSCLLFLCVSVKVREYSLMLLMLTFHGALDEEQRQCPQQGETDE